MDRSTPRPWKWQWTDVNQITIFHNEEGALHGQVVATLARNEGEFPPKRATTEEQKETMEADAELLCRAVNLS